MNRTVRHRPPRRRFHALRADIALVLALVAGLAASFPRMRAPSAAGSGPAPFSAAVAAAPGAAAGASVASPLLFAFGARPDAAAAALPDVPPPPDPAVARRPAWEPAVPAAADPSPLAAAAARPPLPAASMLAGLSPAVPLFSEPRPPPPAPPAEPPAEPVSLVRFRSAPDAPPVVLLDAPGADAARLRALETAAYAEGR